MRILDFSRFADGVDLDGLRGWRKVMPGGWPSQTYRGQMRRWPPGLPYPQGPLYADPNVDGVHWYARSGATLQRRRLAANINLRPPWDQHRYLYWTAGVGLGLRASAGPAALYVYVGHFGVNGLPYYSFVVRAFIVAADGGTTWIGPPPTLYDPYPGPGQLSIDVRVESASARVIARYRPASGTSRDLCDEIITDPAPLAALHACSEYQLGLLGDGCVDDFAYPGGSRAVNRVIDHSTGLRFAATTHEPASDEIPIEENEFGALLVDNDEPVIVVDDDVIVIGLADAGEYPWWKRLYYNNVWPYQRTAVPLWSSLNR